MSAATPIGYDNVQHRWWQLRESGNQVLFETSLDGNSFMMRASTPTPWFVGSGFIEFGAGRTLRFKQGGNALSFALGLFQSCFGLLQSRGDFAGLKPRN